MSNTPTADGITISIVSHGHGQMIGALLGDLARFPEVTRVLLTYNVREEPVRVPSSLISRTEITDNAAPLGFAANHNAAFKRSNTEFFCVLNPDIRLPQNPFPVLLRSIKSPGVALTAPAVVNPDGRLECTARRFPSPLDLILKLFGMYSGGVRFEIGAPPVRPDWVAGMFLLLDSRVFAQVGGFDEAFHMYYEDVDLCARLLKGNHDLVICPETSVVHDARRTSHRHPKFMAWHLRSMMRYFTRYVGRLPARHRTL